MPRFRDLARADRPQVLIVDPDADSRELYASFLTDQGFDVIAAGAAMEALGAMRRRPAAVVTELALPEVDGIELCRLVGRRYGRRVPIVAMTALSSVYYGARAKIAGAARVLTKPCAPDRLEEHLRDLMTTWEASRCRSTDLTRTIRNWRHAAPQKGRSGVVPTRSRTRDGLVVGTLMTNQNGVILDADLGVADLTGYRTEQLVGTPIWNLCPRQHRDKYRDVWRWFQLSGRLRGMVAIVDADGVPRQYQYESFARPALGANLCAITPSASALVA